MIRLHRVGGRPPVDDELVEVADDGSVSVRRTISRAASPPGPVGRFGGQLKAGVAKRIRDEAAVAAGAGNVDLPLPAGAARDDLEVAGGRAVGPAGAAMPARWSGLSTSLRALLTSFASHPVAAVEGIVTGASALELVHLGSEPLDLDLSRLIVRASTWRDDRLVDAVDIPAAGPRAIVAAPGWRYPVEVDLAPLAPGVTRRFELEGLLLGDGETWRVCSLEARPA